MYGSPKTIEELVLDCDMIVELLGDIIFENSKQNLTPPQILALDKKILRVMDIVIELFKEIKSVKGDLELKKQLRSSIRSAAVVLSNYDPKNPKLRAIIEGR